MPKWLCCGLNDTLTSPLLRHGAGLTTRSRDGTQLYAYLYDEANKLDGRHQHGRRHIKSPLSAVAPEQTPMASAKFFKTSLFSFIFLG